MTTRGFKGQDVLYMAFNKNACKRLSIIAGIGRESSKIVDIVDQIVQIFLIKTLRRAIGIVLFVGRKTITVEDLQFLSYICPDHPQIACTGSLSKMMSMCKDTDRIISGKEGYALFTLKKPFDQLMRKITRDLCTDEIRIGKNVSPLLQTMTEHHVITIMNRAGTYTTHDDRETLLPRDIRECLENTR